MGIAKDLLLQADHLATYEGVSPSQASLRRAVSTAYYALFHLLGDAAALRWNGSPEPQTGMERGFRHGAMYSVSTPAIRRIASVFVDLQDERHAADYDNHEQWTALDVQRI